MRTRRRKVRRAYPASWPRGVSAPTSRNFARHWPAARKPCEHGAPRGLRLDQAAAVWHALTSARTVDVITGPAGTGKTRVLAALARAWDGPVFGTATSQNATNELRQAGIQVAANTTRMLGAIQRGMIPPGSLIVADKGSMISVTHLAALTPDGRLWLLRDTYGIQTAWAPRHVGKELRLFRLGAFDAALGAIRADAEAQAARKAGDHDRAARHDHLAASYRAMRDHYQQQERALARDTADRQEWEQATAQSRHLAIAADTELRRRHPYQKIEPLRSAEPAPVGDTEHEQGHAAPGKEISEMTAWTSDLQAQPEEFRAAFHSRQALIAYNADSGWNGLDTLFSASRTPREAAILQPPKPTIAPSARIVERAAEHDVEPEAGS